MLVPTSFLDEVSGSLASAVTGVAHAPEMLDDLTRTHSFVVPIEVHIAIQPTSTVLTAEVGQTGLPAWLDRVRSLGLELRDVRQIYSRRRP
jgi:hypothetical protein